MRIKFGHISFISNTSLFSIKRPSQQLNMNQLGLEEKFGKEVTILESSAWE